MTTKALRATVEPIPQEPSTSTALLPRVRLCDLDEPGKPRWLVSGLWMESAFGIVGAEPKGWKSYLTLLIAICVATGRRLLDRFDVLQGRVLMFAAEGGPVSLRRRAGQLCRGLGIPIPTDLDVITSTALHLDDPATVARIIATVEATRPALLVLDPLRELHAGDENESATIAAILGPLRTLQARAGCAVLVVHHMKKDGDGKGSRRGGQRLRGSSALHGATDSALYLTVQGQGAQKRVTVEAEHRDAADLEPFTLAMRRQETPDGEAVWLEIATDGDDKEERDAERDLAATEARRRKILRAIRLASMPGRDPLRSKRAIREAVGGKGVLVDRAVDALVEEGLIVQKAGAFRLCEGGEGGADGA